MAPTTEKPSIINTIADKIIVICSIARLVNICVISYVPWNIPLNTPTIALNGTIKPIICKGSNSDLLL